MQYLYEDFSTAAIEDAGAFNKESEIDSLVEAFANISALFDELIDVDRLSTYDDVLTIEIDGEMAKTGRSSANLMGAHNAMAVQTTLSKAQKQADRIDNLISDIKQATQNNNEARAAAQSAIDYLTKLSNMAGMANESLLTQEDVTALRNAMKDSAKLNREAGKLKQKYDNAIREENRAKKE